MTKDELFDLIQRFAQRPLPAVAGRHVYLWHGELPKLKMAAPAQVWAQLDLHPLAAALPHAPRASDEAARLLRQAISARLDELIQPERQQIIVITGCDLLSRYQVPLQPLFERASESCLLILVVSPDETHFHPAAILPEYVSFHPDAPFKYLREVVWENAVIDTVQSAPAEEHR